jgi:ribosomal protein S13
MKSDNMISIQNYFMQTFGVGKNLAMKMSYFIGVSPAKPYKAIAEFKKELALTYLQKNNKTVGFQLKNKELNTLIYYDTIGNIKSYKLRAFLPIRGQRNKTNGKTARKNAISLRKLIRTAWRNK